MTAPENKYWSDGIGAPANVDDRIVWEVIRKDLPKLKAEAERRLQGRGG
jgi:uncharacterized protein with HEPN domain